MAYNVAANLRPVRPGQAFLQERDNVLRNALAERDMQLAEGGQQFNQQNALLQRERQQRMDEAAAQEQQKLSEQEESKQLYTYLSHLDRIKSNPEQFAATAQRMVASPLFQRRGIKLEDLTPEEVTTNLPAFAAEAGIAPDEPMGQGPANVQEWEYYNRLSPEQKQQYLEMKRAQQTFLPTIGEVPTVVRPGVAGGPTQMQPLTDIRTVAGNAAAVAGAQTAAQQGAQIGAIPQRAAAEQAATRAGAQIDNARTYNTFVTAMKALESSLSATQTDPITGRLPAATAAAQTAEGAAAAMAPVLKQLFRSSGEGVFTDRDQALLMAMIPTREDLPAARAAKIKMINDLVAAKLGMDASQSAAGAEQTATGPNGEKLVLRNSQWVPL